MKNMKSNATVCLVMLGLALLGIGMVLSAAQPGTEIFFPRFIAQVLDSNFGVGYAVTTADINADGKLDIIAARSEATNTMFLSCD